jgi:hypothetical protein
MCHAEIEFQILEQTTDNIQRTTDEFIIRYPSCLHPYALPRLRARHRGHKK